MNMLVPLGASLLALTAALAAYVMVKFYGVIFLGQMRERALAEAHDCGRLERLGLLWLAVWMRAARAAAGGRDRPARRGRLAAARCHARACGFQRLRPARAGVGGARSAYRPIVFLVGIALVLIVTVLVAKRLYHGRTRRAPPWDCGFAAQDARMQDTAEGFGQPIRHIFDAFFSMRRELPSPFDEHPVYRVTVEDRFWGLLYQPLARAVKRAAAEVGRLQTGRISVYLAYSFVTLIVLLVIVL
jgi:hydrogenase-4 component B